MPRSSGPAMFEDELGSRGIDGAGSLGVSE